MKNKNNKGFTLIELIAVVVILIVIILLAMSIVKKYAKDAKEKSVLANSISYIKAANTLIVNLKGTENEVVSGSYITSELNSLGIALSGTKPTGGIVYIEKNAVKIACLEYDDYHIEYNDGLYSDAAEGSCKINLETNFEFDYTGREQIVTIAIGGTYKLEIWGAQGGSALCNNSIYANNFGYGGYSTGLMTFESGDKLYINVGGRGVNGAYRVNVAGGYNGGGSGTNDNADDESSGGGGGATHIALKSGLLASLDGSRDSVIIVAGGGGGSSYTNAAGAGGGFTGGFTSQTNQNAVNQSVGYAFGKGQNASGVAASDGVGGGGGGWYGGYMNNVSAKSSGSGGSGYIGNNSLTDKVMYCYSCLESTAVSTKTVSTACSSETPTSNCAKIGNGYAKIYKID